MGDQQTIRLATAADLPAIHEIYNHYVLSSTCTYQTVPEPLSVREEWFARHGERHPVTVAVSGEGEVVGWGSLSAFHPRAAYGLTVEDSVYVRHDLLGRGIGRAILGDLLVRAKAAGHHTVMALISADQAASVRLHERMGFERVGLLREVGRKFDRWLDVAYMQRMVGGCDVETWE